VWRALLRYLTNQWDGRCHRVSPPCRIKGTQRLAFNILCAACRSLCSIVTQYA